MSPECNLECSYCNIANAKKTSVCYQDNFLFKNTVESIKNGEYLNNLRKVFERMHQSPNDIERFEVWGQEPTLIFPHLNPHWKDWASFFPNIKTVAFSTNGVGMTEPLAEFIKMLDTYANHEVIMELQYSYDGLYGENEARGYNKEHSDIIENLLQLIEILNSYKFKHVQLNLNLHAVLSSQLLEELSTCEKINQYFIEYDKIIEKIHAKVINRNINFHSADLIMQNCGKFTIEHGFALTKFVNSLNRMKDSNKYQFFKFWEKHSEIARMLFGVMAKDAVEAVLSSPYNSLDEYLDHYAEDKKMFRHCAMCGSTTGFLRIDYSGTIYDCHGSIYDPYLDESKLQQTVFDQTRKQYAKHGQYVNLLTASDEEIDRIIDFYDKTHDPSITLFMFNNLVNQIYLMSLAGEADKSYQYDFNKLKRHAFILARNNQCYHGLKLMNGSMFLRGNEEIRQICNGVMDIIDNVVRQEIDMFRAEGGGGYC